jgi:hypothetical protein
MFSVLTILMVVIRLNMAETLIHFDIFGPYYLLTKVVAKSLAEIYNAQTATSLDYPIESIRQ